MINTLSSTVCVLLLLICGSITTTAQTTPTAVVFTIAAADRVAAKANVAVTLFFKTTTALAINGKITLNYPNGFFATTATPANNAAGTASVATMTATSAAPGATSIVITTATAGIPANTAFTITLSGFTMGALNAGSATGITVQTDADVIASAGVASGSITSQPTAVVMTIAGADRLANKAAVAVTLGFTTTTALSLGGKITLNYPAGFFAGAPNPANNVAGSTSVATMTATSAITGNSIVITTAVAGIAANTIFIITLSGLTMGVVNAGSIGITVQTDADVIPSTAINSGGIFSQIIFTSITSGGITGAAVQPVLVFTPSTTVPAGGTITLTMPTGYFLGSVTSITSTVGSLTAASYTAATATSTSIVLTTAGAATGTAAITMTLTGLILGAAQAAAAAGFKLSSSSDTAMSAGLDAVGIAGTAVSTLGTNQPAITLSNAVRGATGVTMSVTLTPASAIPSNGKIVITLSGAGLAVVGAGTLTFTVGATNTPAGSATISAAGVLTVTMTAGTFATGSALTFTIPGITNPTAVQAASTTVAAATTTSSGIVIDTSTTGTSVAIVVVSQVTGVTFVMTSAQRVPNAAAAAGTAVVTVGFQLASAYAAAGANQITINFPTNFFLTSVPTVICTGGVGLTATVAYAANSQFVLSTTATAWDTTAKVCTFSNVATGATSRQCRGYGAVNAGRGQFACSRFWRAGRAGERCVVHDGCC